MIRVRGLTKTFHVYRRPEGPFGGLRGLIRKDRTTVTAVDHLDFTINAGEMVGLIGPNGAGKSTTVKLLSGVLTPDAGELVVDGLVPWKERRRHVRKLGVVFGQRTQLVWDVPVLDSFRLNKDIYRIPTPAYTETLDHLARTLDLKPLFRTPARQLSLGQRVRCELALALLHRPALLFLDEPTIGLDAVVKRDVRTFLKDLNRREGTTILLTTHDMQDIEALTARTLLIGHGRLLLDGTLDALRAAYGQAGGTLDDLVIALYQGFDL